MKPTQFEMRSEVEEYEDLVHDILEDEISFEASGQISLAASRILAVACQSIGGELRGFDGACISVCGSDEKALRLHGEVFWLEKGFGNSINIDIARSDAPLLYSFKLFDDWETARQTLYIAKTHDGWIYA